MVVCFWGGCAFDCFSFFVGLAVFIVVRKSASLSVCVCVCVSVRVHGYVLGVGFCV